MFNGKHFIILYKVLASNNLKFIIFS